MCMASAAAVTVPRRPDRRLATFDYGWLTRFDVGRPATKSTALGRTEGCRRVGHMRAPCVSAWRFVLHSCRH